jgi:EpsI family protein
MHLPSRAPRARLGRDQLLGLGVVAAFLACYAGVFASLVEQWLTNDVYTHGFLIPLISAYLVYDRREQLAATPVVPDLVGGSLLMTTGLGLLLVGHVGGMISVSQLSLLFSAAGVVLLLLGRAILKQVWLALAYLLFMIPVWEVATSAFQESFQLFSADIGSMVLRLVGIPVRHNGILLELPNVTLKVAEACSGVNFVVAILAVSIPQAYLMLSSVGLRVLVAVLAVLVALLTNGLRVALIGVVSYADLAGADIHGPGHVLQGMSVAVVGFLVMFVIVHILARRSRAHDALPSDGKAARGGLFPRLSPRLCLIACAVLASTGAVQAVPLTTPVDLQAALNTFPHDIGAWRSAGPLAAPSFVSGAGADSEISRRYTAGIHRRVQIYAGYFRYQEQAKELVTERMSVLHEAARVISVKQPNGVSFAANEAVQSSFGGRKYVVFWYDINGRPVVDRYAAKAWTVWDTVSRRRSNGAVVMLVADLPADGNAADVIRETQALAGRTAVALDGYLPR